MLRTSFGVRAQVDPYFSGWQRRPIRLRVVAHSQMQELRGVDLVAYNVQNANAWPS